MPCGGAPFGAGGFGGGRFGMTPGGVGGSEDRSFYPELQGVVGRRSRFGAREGTDHDMNELLSLFTPASPMSAGASPSREGYDVPSMKTMIFEKPWVATF